MRSADYWRVRWAVIPDEDTGLAAQNEKREKAGFVSVASWPLTLLILQGTVFAPLYGSGFLGSSFDDGTEGATVAPTVQDIPGAATTPQAELPDSEEPDSAGGDGAGSIAPSPSATSGSGSSSSAGTSRKPSGSSTTPPSRTPSPSRSADAGGSGGDVATVTPAPPAPQPSPDKTAEKTVLLDLTADSRSSVTIPAAKLYPGRSQSMFVKVRNSGTATLGNLTLTVTSSNPQLSNLIVYSWACSGTWSGTIGKPKCSGILTAGPSFRVGASRLMPYGVNAPGSASSILLSVQLPADAGNSLEGLNTNVNVRFSAQRAG